MLRLPRGHVGRARLRAWIGLVLCALPIVAWALGQRWIVDLDWNDARYRTWTAGLGNGWIRFGRYSPEQTTHPILPEPGFAWHGRRNRPSSMPDRFRFAYTENEYEGGPGWDALFVLPAWPLTALGAAGVVLFARRLTRQPQPCICPSCGYSLVGLRDPRCPECGRERPI